MAEPETRFDPVLVSRVEDAGLNASAPPGQRWIDGWLVRSLPGKARRARCVNALAEGVMPLADRLAQAEAACRASGVPLIFRITPYTRPADLPARLAEHGYSKVDDSLVMIATQLPPATPWPPGTDIAFVSSPEFADIVGRLRGSPAAHVASHTLRLAHCPVPHRAAVVRDGSGAVLCAGQVAIDGDLAGLYDIVTHPEARNRGLASALCRQLLATAAAEGARIGYLQVDAANPPALAVYHRLGFAVAYGYHYLERPAP